MNDISFGSWNLSSQALSGLVRRLQLPQTLARRSIEEEIISLVSSNDKFERPTLESYRQTHDLVDDSQLESFLVARHWSRP